jgi:beta-fructofuranosidase
MELGMNFTPSRWSHDSGRNWEVVNFVSLATDKEGKCLYDFLIFSAEGREPRPGGGIQSANRDDRAQMFICGDLEKTNNGSLSMKFKYGGLLDHGAFYAGNSFWDPVTNTHILWGWIQEDDLSLEMRRRQGWAGVLSFPRALRLITVDCVESALFSVKSVIQSLITVYFTSLSYDTQCECSQLHHFIHSIAHEIDLEAVATM